jgi:hypothetical protein
VASLGFPLTGSVQSFIKQLVQIATAEIGDDKKGK